MHPFSAADQDFAYPVCCDGLPFYEDHSGERSLGHFQDFGTWGVALVSKNVADAMIPVGPWSIMPA